jgi:hypothetical protein
MKPTRAQEESRGENHITARSSQDERREARDQLTLILGFFSRVDAKASAILAINTGMLAVLASNAPPVITMSVFACVLAGITATMIGGSLWFLYRVAFPVLHGGHQSLILRVPISEGFRLMPPSWFLRFGTGQAGLG